MNILRTFLNKVNKSVILRVFYIIVGFSILGFVDSRVCRMYGLSNVWFVDSRVCRMYGLLILEFVECMVCRF